MEDFFLSESLWSLKREELYINSLDNLDNCFKKKKHCVWEVGVKGDGMSRTEGPPYVPVYITLVFSRIVQEPSISQLFMARLDPLYTELDRWGMLCAS